MGEVSRSRRGGKRKIGRLKRKPSHNRYTMEKRWEKNKERRAVKIAKQAVKKAARQEKKEA